MGFWSKLGKIGLTLGGALAAPVTGGASLYPVLAAAGGGAMAGGQLGNALFGSSGDDGGGSAWADDGTFLGDSTWSTSDGSDPGGLGAQMAKFGPAVGAGAIAAYLRSKNENKQIDAQTQARNQATALTESNLDPFRGYMHQAGDASRLDMMANGDFSSKPMQLDAKYGTGLQITPNSPVTPGADTRAMIRQALDQVRAGNKVPTMTNPANYGRMPLVNYTGAPSPAGVLPADDPNDPNNLKRRSAGDSPWLV